MKGELGQSQITEDYHILVWWGRMLGGTNDLFNFKRHVIGTEKRWMRWGWRTAWTVTKRTMRKLLHLRGLLRWSPKWSGRTVLIKLEIH